MVQTIAFIGLGSMGWPMAGHLAKTFTVKVFNRTAITADNWIQQYSGDIASTPADAAAHADVVILCVRDDAALEEVIFGEYGLLQGLSPKTLVIDHTSASASMARKIDDAVGHAGGQFVDAPVSGGVEGAKQGQLTVMCGGHPSAVQKAERVIECYARKVTHMGPAGSGQLAKMVNQICVAGLLQGLSEGMMFAEAAGLDLSQVMRALSKGAAQSWQMENRWETMSDGDYNHGFAVDLMRKDLGLCLKEAQAHQVSLPITALVDQFYGDVQTMNGGDWDTSSLLARLRKQAGFQ